MLCDGTAGAVFAAPSGAEQDNGRPAVHVRARALVRSWEISKRRARNHAPVRLLLASCACGLHLGGASRVGRARITSAIRTLSVRLVFCGAVTGHSLDHALAQGLAVIHSDREATSIAFRRVLLHAEIVAAREIGLGVSVRAVLVSVVASAGRQTKRR